MDRLCLSRALRVKSSVSGMESDSEVAYSDRAKMRLKTAAALLRHQDGMRFNFGRNKFYTEIMKVIAQLPTHRQESLRRSVDLVEEFILEYDAAIAAEEAKNKK